jgi:hypothetical protein
MSCFAEPAQAPRSIELFCRDSSEEEQRSDPDEHELNDFEEGNRSISPGKIAYTVDLQYEHMNCAVHMKSMIYNIYTIILPFLYT